MLAEPGPAHRFPEGPEGAFSPLPVKIGTDQGKSSAEPPFSGIPQQKLPLRSAQDPMWGNIGTALDLLPDPLVSFGDGPSPVGQNRPHKIVGKIRLMGTALGLLGKIDGRKRWSSRPFQHRTIPAACMLLHRDALTEKSRKQTGIKSGYEGM